MDEVQAFYDKNAQAEWDRLDHHRTEFAVTLRAFDEYLPSSQAKVLDIGGGPGRYSIELAKRGYQVTLFDLSQKCIQFALEKAEEAGVSLAGVSRGNATDLGQFKERTFDVVLLMGPLYHLLEEDARNKVVRETHRVLKKRGLVFASFITRYAPLRWSAKNEPEWLPLDKEILETGKWRPSLTGTPSGARVDSRIPISCIPRKLGR